MAFKVEGEVPIFMVDTVCERTRWLMRNEESVLNKIVWPIYERSVMCLFDRQCPRGPGTNFTWLYLRRHLL